MRTIPLLILIVLAVFLSGCTKPVFLGHHPTQAATVVEHIPEEAVDRSGDLGTALRKGILYRGIVVGSVWEWGFLEPAHRVHCSGQARYGYYGGSGLRDWLIILCFDRRDIAPGLPGSVTNGWFELVYSDAHRGVHIYQWRDARRVDYRYPSYQPPARWFDDFRVQNRVLVK